MPKAVDLFCGMGGLAYGFYKAGFDVEGFDNNKYAPRIFELNKIHGSNEYKCKIKDLENNIVSTEADIIIGGPPCKPWSPINLSKRGKKHPDFWLLDSFFYHIYYNKPYAFLMENVPFVKRSDSYHRWLRVLNKYYNIGKEIFQYDEYGSASQRKRLITVGFKKGLAKFTDFTEEITKYKEASQKVWDVINTYQKYSKRGYYDHIWSNLKTIEKYRDKYENNKFGWYHLKSDCSAPSFGNVMKTYTLHPNGMRTVSVREVMAIMGFPDQYRFPENMGHTIKYQMVADVVSPTFSYAAARTIRDIFNENNLL